MSDTGLSSAGVSPVVTPPNCVVLRGPRVLLGTRLIACVISERVHGLSLEVNLCPIKFCNFRCVYCQVDRSPQTLISHVDVEVVHGELQQLLKLIYSGRLRSIKGFEHLPLELLKLHQVVLSGGGEPTFCPNFAAAIEAIITVRATGQFPFFKLVLATNASGLNLPEVRRGLSWFTSHDEIWAKLDAGTPAYMKSINNTRTSFQRVLANILQIAQQRPVVIQSLFIRLDGQEPTESEILEYIRRLLEFKNQGAQITQVQIYSTRGLNGNRGVSHLPLKTLSAIGRQVRIATGLEVEVF